MNAQTLHELYECWAPLYPAEPHNPLMKAEQTAMLARLPPLAGVRALDLACGSGRYARCLAEGGAALVVALDFSAAMLHRVARGNAVRGDLLTLPLRDAGFDVVVSGLALGHASDLRACMREIARVLKPGGTLLYSDFHPLAQQRGHVRTFRDPRGALRVLPFAGHDRDEHLAALAAARLDLDALFEPRAGLEFQEKFPASEQFYRDWRGVPMLLIAQAHKPS
jgi:malonyl-CoA O-methyltransferase